FETSDFYRNFEDNRWAFNKEVTFDFELKKNQEFWVHFGHIYNYNFASVPIELEFVKENDTLNKIVVNEKIIIKDNNGEDKGDCLGDICDVYQKLDKDLEPGNYKLSIRNLSELPYLPKVLGIGYQIRKPKE